MKIIFSSIITILIVGFTQIYGEIQFEETTELAGIYYSGRTYGSSWGDFNSDGWPDLFTGNHGPHGSGVRLYLNNADGTFTDISLELELTSILKKDIHTSSWADFDNDKDSDLLIAVGAAKGYGDGPNALLVNSNGRFTDEAKVLGLDYSYGRGRMPLWFDFNRDSFLDVLLINYPRPDLKASTALFKQEPKGFNKASEIKHDDKVWMGSIDDFLDQGNYILVLSSPTQVGFFDINKTPFNEKSNELGITSIRSIDFVLSDFNNDLKSDIFYSRAGWDAQNYRNDKVFFFTTSGFTDVTDNVGLDKPTACRGISSGDFDNDMDIDIYAVCSLWGLGKTYAIRNIPNLVYENIGNGTFSIQNAIGALGTIKGTGETVSVADYDQDGFLDLFVTNGWGTPDYEDGRSQLFRNKANDNNWLEIDLIGTKSNRDAIGTSMIVSANDTKQIRKQNGGMHYNAQNYQRLHFGLGNNTMVDSLIVHWPSGIVSGQKDIPVNQILKITEPEKSIPPSKQFTLGINSKQVKCNDNLSLVINHKSEPACVKQSSIAKLSDRGWVKEQ